VRGRKADDEIAQGRRFEPERDLPPQHAALTLWARRPALAGDHQHNSRTLRRGGTEEPGQQIMGLREREPMQIHAGIDRLATARKTLPKAAVEFYGRRLSRRRAGDTG
jgi:hypothetical protein